MTLDIVIARPWLREKILATDAGVLLDGLVLVATHTHSGPGGHLEGWLAERLTAGSFDPGAAPRLVRAAVVALERAHATLVPVRAGALVAGLDLARNRRHPGGAREQDVSVLRLDRLDGSPLAVVFSYGVHSVVLGPSNLRHSADLAGAMRRRLDEAGFPALFVPGALGDQNPLHETRSPWSAEVSLQEAELDRAGERGATAVRNAARSIATRAGADLVYREIRAETPPLALRRGSLLAWLSPLVASMIERFLSDDVAFSGLDVGNARLLGIPAEPATALGDAIRSALPPDRIPLLVSHANDWLGYALAEEDYATGGYEADLSLFGPGFGEWLVGRSVAVSRELDLARRR